MLTDLLKYKDYYARIALDTSADAFHGRVIGIQDVIDVYGRTPEELGEEFKNSVDVCFVLPVCTPLSLCQCHSAIPQPGQQWPKSMENALRALRLSVC